MVDFSLLCLIAGGQPTFKPIQKWRHDSDISDPAFLDPRSRLHGGIDSPQLGYLGLSTGETGCACACVCARMCVFILRQGSQKKIETCIELPLFDVETLE